MGLTFYFYNKLLYSVTYHPETNAIEEFFNQLKHYIKKEKSKYINYFTFLKTFRVSKVSKNLNSFKLL
jgi:hypothetical protein